MRRSSGVDDKGFILITLLILLMVLSALAVQAVNGSLVQMRMSHNGFLTLQQRQDVENVLRRAEAALSQAEPTCVIHAIPADYVLQVKVNQGLGFLPHCRVALAGGRQGYYVVQAIQRCGEVVYYRLTAWPEGEGVLLQTTTDRRQRLSWRVLF